MKKVVLVLGATILGLASSVMAANVVNNDTTTVDVYGYGKAAHVFNQQSVKNGVDKSEVQLGVKVKQKLNQNFALIGQYEGEYDFNDSSARHIHHRKVFGGVDGGSLGAITVGRQQGLIYDVAGMTDMMPEVVSGWSSAPDTGLLGRADSVIQYQNTIGNVTFNNQYKLATTQSVETGKKVNEGAAYGSSVVVHNLADSGVFVGGAYSHQELVATNGSSDVFSVGAGWTDGKYYTAATSTVGKRVAGAKSFYDNEAVAQYTFDNGITPSLGYVDSNAFGSKAKFVETGVSYAFNKNVSADIDLGWDVTSADNNQVKTSVKYKF